MLQIIRKHNLESILYITQENNFLSFMFIHLIMFIISMLYKTQKSSFPCVCAFLKSHAKSSMLDIFINVTLSTYFALALSIHCPSDPLHSLCTSTQQLLLSLSQHMLGTQHQLMLNTHLVSSFSIIALMDLN